MAEYIEREALLEKQYNASRSNWPQLAEMVVDVRDIEDAPAADVAPVVHARWEHKGGDEWGCTACGAVVSTEGSWDRPGDKYCRHCGAKMDEPKEGE